MAHRQLRRFDGSLTGNGVARNFQQGMHQSLAFLAIHPAELPYQVGRTIKKRHDMNRLYDYE